MKKEKEEHWNNLEESFAFMNAIRGMLGLDPIRSCNSKTGKKPKKRASKTDKELARFYQEAGSLPWTSPTAIKRSEY